VAAAIGRYIVDPDPSVIAARLIGDAAHRFAMAAIAPASAWLTGDLPPTDPLFTPFAVQDVLPYDVRRLRRHARERRWGPLEIKVRGIKLDPEKVRRDVKTSGDDPVTLLVARVQGQVTVVVARREANEPPV
jgi:hypothetical protein